ncbi:putative CAAX prenyl protease 1 [Leishmania major strain Friedlin]|uniref:CAAX prenyl protease n=1 Tax=Leishmania major TaxID=5664 RepID=E9ACY1_LEIMA|nr:putative CAAX prenyl protease 1 [Leishmania major strain Friedlin]CAG9576605.1 CAAX_prenyl_protease_1_-_putative [Leishmania major strain Friedlin]CBZ12064.1 putative CAAX prenyl protease 1 [Leishmania major strain Friedlin]|eukprot:XP_003721810.1 putative CAAX prenyl protease 1 [Leishmania major strain Friedlin]
MSSSPNLFLRAAVVSLNVIGMWDAYLVLRQRRANQTKEMPSYFRKDITDEEFAKAKEYESEKSTFSFLQHLKGLVLTNMGIFLRLPALLYYLVAQRASLSTGSFSHNYAAAVAGELISVVLDIPFSYYENFHIEDRHGLNEMTKTEFVKDIVKTLLLRVTLLYPMQIKLIQFVVQRFGERFPLYLFFGMSVMLVVFLLAMPTVIQPLFNKFTPLDAESPLYKKIELLSKEMSFPLKKVFVVDGSRRSHHSNAYFYGFGSNKRIVLYDTILEQLKDDDEPIIAVLCHELGHWKHNHIYVNLAMALGQLMLISYGARLVVFDKRVYEALGFREVDPVVGLNIFAEMFYEPLSTFIGYGFCYVSRRHEFQADRFAVTHHHGEGMKKALLVISKENRASLTPDPLYSALHYTHPPVLERLQAIDAELKKRE